VLANFQRGKRGSSPRFIVENASMTADLEPGRRARFLKASKALSFVVCAASCFGGAGNPEGLDVKVLKVGPVEQNKLDPMSSIVTITLDRAVRNDVGYLVLPPAAGHAIIGSKDEPSGSRCSVVRYIEHRASGIDDEPAVTTKIRIAVATKDLSTLKDRLPMTAKLYLKKRGSKRQ
jgi:hypothetical protein